MPKREELMSGNKRWIIVALSIVAWGILVGVARTFLAPLAGAATVLQMNASDASYLLSMSFLNASSIATILITGVFVLVIYLILRSKK